MSMGSPEGPPKWWSRAPRSITSLAYGALLLLSVAATALSVFRGSPGALIISVVICSGIFFLIFRIRQDRAITDRVLAFHWKYTHYRRSRERCSNVYFDALLRPDWLASGPKQMVSA